jgi:hypothetical protein
MAEHTPPQVREAASACGAARGGLSRRQLVRAGLSAGTVAATLKSNTVLANGTVCIMASAFSSLDANPLTSQALTQVGGACIDSQSWTTRTTARVTSDFKLNTKVSDLGFTLPYPGVDSSSWGNVTVAAALVYAGADSKFNQLLRSTVAAYLTAYDLGDVGVVLTTTQGLRIWNSSGVWAEPSGIAFDLDKTLRYFAKIGVV